MTSNDLPSESPEPPIAAVASVGGTLAEEIDLIVNSAAPPSPRRAVKKGGVVASALAASMLAIGDIIEPQRTEVGVEAAADETDTKGLLDTLDFGGLPPLN